VAGGGARRRLVVAKQVEEQQCRRCRGRPIGKEKRNEASTPFFPLVND